MKLPSKKLSSLTPGLTQKAAHVSAVCLLSATLAACGGSSGGGDGTMTGGTGDDTDINPLFTDVTPPFPISDIDLDGDGLYNTEEVTLGLDPNSLDTNGDGTLDGDEDSDGDFISNIDEATAGTLLDGFGDTPDVTDTPVPVQDRCTDPDSSNDSWADNCLLKENGTWATSTYTQGVQRILWCGDFRNGNATTIGGFADGIFGPNTDQSVRDYQTARSLLVDGKVGPETWGELRKELSLIDTLSTSTEDAHSIIGCDSATVQFYNQTEGLDFLGWTMASTPGSATAVPFSNAAP